ncbi:MAG TPA: SxtJ family membrane protein [Pyrinomonadaceae bacterium]|nr:SxtJ family membrane protein [Pyrinomonadaceae bacterium]
MIEPTKTKEKKKNPKASNVPEVSNAQARKTALVVAAVFLAIALWNVYRGRMTQVTIFGGIAGAITLIGLIPVAARAFHRFWMGIAAVLGYVNSRILLSVLYYGLFTPVGLVRRLIGRDPLQRRGKPQSSYWVTREYTRQAKEQFERLF